MLVNRFFVLILFVCTLPLFSFTTKPVDPGNDILNRSRRQIAQMQDLTSSFSYLIEHPSRQPVVQSGSFIYQRGNYLIDLPSQRLICNQQNLWVYLKKENSVSVQTYDPNKDASINRIFEVYRTSSVQVKHVGTEQIGNMRCDKLVLNASSRSQSFTQAILWVDQRTALPSKIVMMNRSGTTFTYLFSNHQINRGISDRIFSFDPAKYPGVSYRR